MLQFYFLSILCNLVAGIILIFYQDNDEPVSGAMENFSFLNDKTFKLVLGILTFGVGFFKLLSVVRGDVPVVGDFIPALAGLAGGFAILLEYYMSTSTTGFTPQPALEAIFIHGRKYVGFFCMLAALLHFLFPSVLFL